MFQRVRVLGVLIVALLAVPALVSAEGFQTFLGNTSVGAFFNRPNASCGATGTNVRFQAQRFRLGQAATCSIYSAQSYDGFIHLYAGTFNPGNPTANCVTGNDDDTPAPNLGIGTSVLRNLDLAANTNYTLVTSAFSGSGSGAFSNTIHCGSESGTAPSLLTVQPRHGSCPATFVGIPLDQQVCLQGERFIVAIDQITNSATGLGTPVRAGSSDTGLFWFYNDRNWEVVIKVLDGCSVNGRWWVFIGALTNQGYRVRVADGNTLQINTYTNPLGTRAAAVADTNAFPCP